MTPTDLQRLKEICENASNAALANIARDAMPALIEEVERLRLEASVWKRMENWADGDKRYFRVSAREAAHAHIRSGDFAAASKLLDEAGYKEE